MLFAQPSYYAQFNDTGGLNKGDKVRIAGMDVGTVQSLAIDGDHIILKFTTGRQHHRHREPAGDPHRHHPGQEVHRGRTARHQTLRPGGALPVGQSTTPYQIYDAFFDVTKAACGWDIDTVKRSLNVLSQTVDQTYPHLSAALDGVAKFSDTIGKRDEQIKHLLAQANQVAGILGDRGEQINTLLVNAKTLLAAFNERGRAIALLLATNQFILHSGAGADQRQPQPQPRARAVSHHQRHPGQAQKRPGRSVLITIGKFAAALSRRVLLPVRTSR